MSFNDKKIDKLAPEERQEEHDPVLSCFRFVGFGWKLSEAFVFVFDQEIYFIDEAYLKAKVEFSHRFPRCSAAVFFMADIKSDEKNAILYEYYNISDVKENAK